MVLFFVFHLIVLALLIVSKWIFWTIGRNKYLRVSLLLWGVFFLISISSLWLYLDQGDFLAYFALPFFAFVGFFDLGLIWFALFSFLFLASFIFLPIRVLRKDAKERGGLVWKCYLLDLFLYFSLLPSILIAFGQVSFYGAESPGVRDPRVWQALLYYPAFWALGILDAHISAWRVPKRVEDEG